MAAAAESRKRFASPFVDGAFCDLAKRGRYTTTPCALDPLDALRGIFPDASPGDLEASFAASGGDIHATAQAYRSQHALASHLAAAAESRKRFASPFVDGAFCDLAKRGRYTTTPCALDPLDALRGIFPDASPGDLEASFAASGGDIHATAQAYRSQHALASHLAQADAEECAGVLVEQMAAATDASDARNRASWILGLIKNAAAAEAARLREENAALMDEAARLREEAAALREHAAAAEHDNAVLKRGVLAVLQKYV